MTYLDSVTDRNKRLTATGCNAFVSLIVFVILFFIFLQKADDSEWKQQTPSQIYGFYLDRSENSSQFDLQQLKAATASTPEWNSNTVEQEVYLGLLEEMRCKTHEVSQVTLYESAKCKCFGQLIHENINIKRADMLSGQVSWKAVRNSILDNADEKCKRYSVAYEMEIDKEPSSILLGIVVWWGFATIILAYHLYADWDENDWLYRGSILLFFILAPVGMTSYLVLGVENWQNMWFFLFAGFFLQYFTLKMFLNYVYKFRNDDRNNKRKVKQLFNKKVAMASLTAFALAVTSRMSVLLSGRNYLMESLNVTTTAAAIALYSIALRLICGSLETLDQFIVKELQTNQTTVKNVVGMMQDFRKSLVFSAQWVWSICIIVAIMLVSVIPFDHGDGIVECSILAKFSLGLIAVAIALQFPAMMSTSNQWLSLQLIEFAARIFAFVVFIIYTTT
jgi:hypothetical protein